ncbi:hypothetical protein C8R43DRAFT_951571 [Mycena crocata]|nr:hypothetical protein C8R43DRAFT_951571 [Mycena crocata]
MNSRIGSAKGASDPEASPQMSQLQQFWLKNVKKDSLMLFLESVQGTDLRQYHDLFIKQGFTHYNVQLLREWPSEEREYILVNGLQDGATRLEGRPGLSKKDISLLDAAIQNLEPYGQEQYPGLNPRMGMARTSQLSYRRSGGRFRMALVFCIIELVCRWATRRMMCSELTLTGVGPLPMPEAVVVIHYHRGWAAPVEIEPALLWSEEGKTVVQDLGLTSMERAQGACDGDSEARYESRV